MNTTLVIVAAQINLLVGDIAGNTKKIISVAKQARDMHKADIVVFPEMTLTGYPPEDLLLRPELYQHIATAIKTIQQELTDIYVIIGYPEQNTNYCYNTAALLHNGKILAQYHKQQLPNYDVFDEKRYFTPGNAPCIVNIKGIDIALSICEDLWFPDQMADAKAHGAKLMIGLNASPFDIHKAELRTQIMSKRAKEGNMPVVYVNCVGGQDDLVFDGGSMVMDATGRLTQRADFFTETLLPITINLATPQPAPISQNIAHINSEAELAYQALVLGVRDYVNKNNFAGVVIGSSGGIDSALTLAIAVDALGKDRVESVFMPSRYTETLSNTIAIDLAKMLDIKLTTVSIEPLFISYLNSLKDLFTGLPSDVTEENLQARCRGTLLMAIANKKHLMVLATSNKSETAVGYATLYGDMVGGLCVLQDVPKTLVYELAAYRNKLSPVIPQAAIDRPPSAELANNQQDTDTLPPYPILDAIIARYVELNQSAATISAAGFDSNVVNKVISMIKRSEYKRRQAPPGIRITTRAFGRDYRYPITSGF